MEKLAVPYPYACPHCGEDLEQPGMVIGWIELPDRVVGHVSPGSEDCVELILDNVPFNPTSRLQCSNCGEGLDKLNVEDMYLGAECEESELEELEDVEEGSEP